MTPPGVRGHEREVLPLKMQRRKDVLTDWWSLKGLISSSQHIKHLAPSPTNTLCIHIRYILAFFNPLATTPSSALHLEKNPKPIHPQTAHLSPFPRAGSGQLLLQTQHLSTLDDEEGQHHIAAAVAAITAVGKGIKMFALSIPPSLCLYAVPSGCLSRPRARSSRWMGFPPITHSLKPSSMCKTRGGRKTERVGFVCLQVGVVYIQSK